MKNARKLGPWRIWFRQLGILIRKNFLLQIRRPFSTIFSCLVGLILAFLLIGRNESKERVSEPRKIAVIFKAGSP